MRKQRNESELPEAIKEWGWKYHHIGIPTDKIMPNERYISKLKMYVSGFDISPYGIEWMRFDNDSPISLLIQTIPHIAFEVDDINREITYRNLKVISEPSYPADGIKVAMIEHNYAPIELIEFTNRK